MIRRIALALLLVLVLGVGYGTWHWYLPIRSAVGIGAGMLSKEMCSCVFVARREARDCRSDQLESLARIEFEIAGESVRAFVPLFGDRTAIYREGLGCTLE